MLKGRLRMTSPSWTNGQVLHSWGRRLWHGRILKQLRGGGNVAFGGQGMGRGTFENNDGRAWDFSACRHACVRVCVCAHAYMHEPFVLDVGLSVDQHVHGVVHTHLMTVLGDHSHHVCINAHTCSWPHDNMHASTCTNAHKHAHSRNAMLNGAQ